MDLATDDVCEVVRTVWDCVLGLPIEPAAPAAEWQDDDRYLGAVSISGTWTGVVVLEASRNAAVAAACRMFPDDAEHLAEADLRDALAELTNIIGGNIKSLVPGPSSLALPSVTTGNQFSVRVPNAAVLCAPLFFADGQPLRVEIWGKAQDRNARD